MGEQAEVSFLVRCSDLPQSTTNCLTQRLHAFPPASTTSLTLSDTLIAVLEVRQKGALAAGWGRNSPRPFAVNHREPRAVGVTKLDTDTIAWERSEQEGHEDSAKREACWVCESHDHLPRSRSLSGPACCPCSTCSSPRHAPGPKMNDTSVPLGGDFL